MQIDGLTSMMSGENRDYRRDINGLRALSIVPVIWFHAFPEWLAGGFAGVDVFFVISGFLITGILQRELANDQFRFAEFYVRRIRRIFPALLFLFAGVWAIGWFTLLADEFAEVGKHILSGAFFTINFTLLGESNYFERASSLKPLLNLWSLAIEEQYYIVWPLILWLLWRARRRIGIFKATCVLIAASFAFNIFVSVHDRAADFFLPMTRFWELLVGGLLAQAYDSSSVSAKRSGFVTAGLRRRFGDELPIASVQSSFGALLLIVSFLGLRESFPYPGWWALAPVIGTLLLIDAGPDAWFNRRVLARRDFGVLGLLSYSLYLWHWPLLAFVHSMNGRTSWTWAALALSFGLATFSYYFVETPFRHRRRIWHFRTSSVLLVAMLAMAGAGWATWSNDGFLGRFPEVVRYLADYTTRYQFDFGYDGGSAYRYKRCFLTNSPEKIKNPHLTFADECIDPGFAGAPNSMLLWGDSHAAQFYAGFRAWGQAHELKIAQFNTGACPPYDDVRAEDLAEELALCQRDNAIALDQIRKLKPSTVVIAANWKNYPREKVARTLRSVKKLGVPRIVLIGPVPQWPATMPKNIFLEIQSDPLRRFPERLTRGLDEAIAPIDDELRAVALSEGVQFVSPYRFLCNAQGCLTRVGLGADQLVAFDYAHLTPSASRYLIEHLAPQIFVK